MNFIIYVLGGAIILFVIVSLLFLVQLLFYLNNIFKAKTTKRISKQIDQTYPKEISELGEGTMRAVQHGRLKKHLLSNDAPIYNSNDTANQYIAFVDHSTIYKKVLSVKEIRFHG